MKLLPRVACLFAALGAVISEAPSATAEGEASSTVLQPGVVVDEPSGSVVLMSPDGAVESVELTRGALQWRTPGAGKPLAIVGGRVLTQTDPTAGDVGLPLSVLDARTGEVLRNATVKLDEGVAASINATPEGVFEADAVKRGERVFVRWRFDETWHKGTPPERGWKPRRLFGIARVDLNEGRVENVAEIPPEQKDPIVELLQAQLQGREWQFPIGRVEKMLWTARGGASDPQSGEPTIQRWDATSGESLQVMSLVKGYEPKLASSDGRYLLASRPLPVQDAGSRRFRWSVLDPTDGHRVAETERESAASPFVIAKATLLDVAPPRRETTKEAVVVEPLRLRGAALSENRTWVRPLRDVRTRTSPPGVR